jgi:hypothetical protein
LTWFPKTKQEKDQIRSLSVLNAGKLNRWMGRRSGSISVTAGVALGVSMGVASAVRRMMTGPAAISVTADATVKRMMTGPAPISVTADATVKADDDRPGGHQRDR